MWNSSRGKTHFTIALPNISAYPKKLPMNESWDGFGWSSDDSSIDARIWPCVGLIRNMMNIFCTTVLYEMTFEVSMALLQRVIAFPLCRQFWGIKQKVKTIICNSTIIIHLQIQSTEKQSLCMHWICRHCGQQLYRYLGKTGHQSRCCMAYLFAFGFLQNMKYITFTDFQEKLQVAYIFPPGGDTSKVLPTQISS